MALKDGSGPNLQLFREMLLSADLSLFLLICYKSKIKEAIFRHEQQMAEGDARTSQTQFAVRCFVEYDSTNPLCQRMFSDAAAGC